MTRYALYFDAPAVDGERRFKRAVAAFVIALHALVLWWALRTHPNIMPAATSLVVVRLNGLTNAIFPDRTKHDATPKLPSPRPAVHRAKRSDRPVRDELPAGGIDREAVSEGKQRRGSADDDSALTGTLRADAYAAGTSVASNDAAGGRGALFGRFLPPQVIHRARLAYPPAAIARDAQGDVDVLVTIAADGTLLDARVSKSSGNAALDEAALASVRLYRFKAAERDGKPLQAQAYVTVEWRITPRERFEFAKLRKPEDVHLDAEVKALEFLNNAPPRRAPCDHMKNPDCVP